MESQEEKALKVLQLAEDNSPLDSLSDLVKEGVSLDKQDKRGWSPLHYASYRGNVESVKNLLDNGAKTDVKNKDGVTAFHMAARLPQVDVLLLFLNRGVSLGKQDNQGLTALHHACDSGRPITMWYLLDRGAKADIRDIKGQTALHLAAQQNNIKPLTFLIEKGADVNIKDNCGWTPLHFAALRNLPYNIEYLLEKSAYIDAENEDGDTVMHIAARASPYPGQLFCYSASVGIRNKAGKTAYQLLTEREPVQNMMVQSVLDVRNKRMYDEQCLKMEVLHSPSSEVNMPTLRCDEEVNKKVLEKEVLQIKSTQIVEGFTLYDLVTECEKPAFLFDANLVQMLVNLLNSSGFTNRFPHYGHILRTKFSGVGRTKSSRSYLMCQAIESVFNDKRQKWCNVTHDIWRHIFSFLHKDDLVAFTKSGDN